MNNGDVIRFTRFQAGPTKNTDEAEELCSRHEPIWGVITDDDSAYFFWVSGGNKLGRRWRDEMGPENWPYEVDGQYGCGDWDNWDFVEPDQWPEDVCVAVARYKLVGDAA